LRKGYKLFILYTVLLIILLSALLLAFGHTSFTGRSNGFLNVPFFIASLLSIVGLFAILISVLKAYSRRDINKSTRWLLKTGLFVLVPFYNFVSGIFKVDVEALNLFYVDLNNIMVRSCPGKYTPDKILLLLPHCMQNSECLYKVTGKISNCRRCGRCKIGEIAEIFIERGIHVEVVSGGTAARKLVMTLKPRLVLAVACERELTSGILDAGDIPVIAIINQRPEGPCNNTTINTEELRNILERILV